MSDADKVKSAPDRERDGGSARKKRRKEVGPLPASYPNIVSFADVMGEDAPAIEAGGAAAPQVEGDSERNGEEGDRQEP